MRLKRQYTMAKRWILEDGGADIVVALGDDPHARNCLHSIWQCTSTSYQLFAIDQSHNPDLAALLWEARAKGLLTYVEDLASHSLACALNQGLACSSSPYIAVLTDADEVTPLWLEGLVAAALGDPRIGIVIPRVIPLRHPVSGQHETDADTAMKSSEYGVHEDFVFDCSEVQSTCLLLTRRCMKTVGRFRETYQNPVEMIKDYCLRAQMAGYRVVHTLGATVRCAKS
jgi:GT2 family glycosyltransferase